MGQIPQAFFLFFFIATVTKRFERKYFWNLPGKISSEQLRKVEKTIRSVTAKTLKMPHFDHFPRPGEYDPYALV